MKKIRNISEVKFSKNLDNSTRLSFFFDDIWTSDKCLVYDINTPDKIGCECEHSKITKSELKSIIKSLIKIHKLERV